MLETLTVLSNSKIEKKDVIDRNLSWNMGLELWTVRANKEGLTRYIMEEILR